MIINVDKKELNSTKYAVSKAQEIILSGETFPGEITLINDEFQVTSGKDAIELTSNLVKQGFATPKISTIKAVSGTWTQE